MYGTGRRPRVISTSLSLTDFGTGIAVKVLIPGSRNFINEKLKPGTRAKRDKIFTTWHKSLNYTIKLLKLVCYGNSFKSCKKTEGPSSTLFISCIGRRAFK